MVTYSWTTSQDLNDSYKQARKHWDKIRSQMRMDQINERKYFEGFKVGREKSMFKEELEDLDKVYDHLIKTTSKEISDLLPSLLYYMEQFVVLHSTLENGKEKLDELREKMGTRPQEDSNE